MVSSPTLTLPSPLDTWSTPALATLGAFVSIAVALLVTAVILWVRTPDSAMPAPSRWAWLAILFVQIVGPIAFMVLRRRSVADARDRERLAAAEASRARPSAETRDGAPAPAGTTAPSAAASAADLLYGARHG